MDYTALLDVDNVSDEFEKERTRQKPNSPKKKHQYRTRKGRKPNKPSGYMGQRSNKRLKSL